MIFFFPVMSMLRGSENGLSLTVRSLSKTFATGTNKEADRYEYHVNDILFYRITIHLITYTDSATLTNITWPRNNYSRNSLAIIVHIRCHRIKLVYLCQVQV